MADVDYTVCSARPPCPRRVTHRVENDCGSVVLPTCKSHLRRTIVAAVARFGGAALVRRAR